MRTKRTLPMLVVAGLLIAGCGGSSKSGASTSTSGKTTTAPAGSLVLQPSETPSGFTVSTAPSTAPSTSGFGPEGFQRTFGSAAATAQATMRASGSSDYKGPSGSELVSNANVLATPADAKAVWSGFADASGGNKTLAVPSGAPGEQQGLYETKIPAGLGITYLFREGNVLSQVEVDGVSRQFPVSEVIALANKQDAHIRSTLK